MKTDDEQNDYTVDKTEIDDALEMLGTGYNNDPVTTEFISTMSGFTPAPDVISKDCGPITSLVWGRVWRYCQMSDGVCRASLEKIAGSVGMSERTIIRHLEVLCDRGYLFDTTPNLRNKPHIYADTGKIKIRFSGEVTMTKSQRAMTKSQRQGDKKSVEESIKKPIKKKDSEPKANTIPEIVLFRSVRGRYPARASWDTIIKAIRDVSSRLGREVMADDLKPFYEGWCNRGWNENAVTWLTDYAVTGKSPNGQKQIENNEERPEYRPFPKVS